MHIVLVTRHEDFPREHSAMYLGFQVLANDFISDDIVKMVVNRLRDRNRPINLLVITSDSARVGASPTCRWSDWLT